MSNTKSLEQMESELQEILNKPYGIPLEAEWLIEKLAERGIVLTSDPCIAKHPDQPCFVLIAQDPLAPELVDTWATKRIEDDPQAYNHDPREREWVDEANRLADQMRDWRAQHPKP